MMGIAQEKDSETILKRIEQSTGGVARTFDRKVIDLGNSTAATIPAQRKTVFEELCGRDEIRVHLMRDGRLVIEDPRIHTDLSTLLES